MEHYCHAIGCRIHVQPERLFCTAHWRMVPRHLQRAVWDTYTPGQCKKMKLVSLEWMLAARRAIYSVALKEGRITEKEAKEKLERLIEVLRIEGEEAWYPRQS
jgi:hypothetical protein